MHISFDNIDELSEFLEFIGAARSVDREVAPMPRSPLVITEYESVGSPMMFSTDGCVTIAPDEAQTPEQSITQASAIEQMPAEEKPKRTRRTKAEMKAARAAESAPETTSESAAAQPQDEPQTTPVVIGRGNPFAAPEDVGNAAIQAALSGAPAAQTLAALAEVQVPTDVPAAAAVPPSTKPTNPEHIKAWLEATATGNIGPLDMGAHMARAKAFIAKHGTAKYNETFVVAGLDPNIMVYTDEQRSYHAAALEFVDWS